MALAGTVCALTGNLVLLIAAAVIGTISPNGQDVGPFLSIEQAILPQTSDAARRNAVFAWYNLVRSAAGAVGALAAGLPSAFQAAGMDGVASYRVLIWLYAGIALIVLLFFARLSPLVEVEQRGDAARPHAAGRLGIHRSRGIVVQLTLLFGLDSFAGGFVVQTLLAYWFQRRFGADPATLGRIFFGTNMLAAVSFLAAAPLARRFGLLNTMVFTHLPSNILLMLVPLMPTLPLAVIALFARFLLSQMDVPTRQSYTVAVVDPDERAAASGLTNIARSTGNAASPILSGALIASAASGLPFFIAGVIKIGYDIGLCLLFRDVRPPEEAELAARRTRVGPVEAEAAPPK